MKDLILSIKNYLFRYRALKQYKTAISNENLSTDEMNKLNFIKRKNLINYAYNHIPFYKEFYDKKQFHPDMLRSENDWDKVPILEKEMIRSNLDNIRNPHVNKKWLGVSTTGGSTGHPLKLYLDKRFCFEVLGWRAFRWYGLTPASNIGIVHRRTPTTFIATLKNRLLWWPTNRIYLNASSIDEKQLLQFTNKINKKKIKWLQGYVGGLEKVADFILKNNISITTLKLVWATSAPISKSARQKMQKAFKCKIMNQYGSCEIPNIAIQCPNSEHLHVHYDFVHVDIVDKDDKVIYNEEGDVIVTNLESYAFPLIRYRIGDKSTWIGYGCSDNISLPLIAEIKGRVSDAVYTPDGVFVDGSYLTTIFDDYSDIISQFQVYQKKDYSLTIYIVVYKQSKNVESVLSKIKNKIGENVQNKISVDIQLVDSIDDDQGKIRYIRSEVKKNK